MRDKIVKYLQDMLDLDESETGEFIEVFLETLDQSCEQLTKQLESPDFAQIRVITHTIIGFAGNMGAEELTAAARKLNQAAHAADIDNCIAGARDILELQKLYHQ